MEILNCSLADIDTVLTLYRAARDLQTRKGMVVWPVFPTSLVEQEVKEGRQWKLLIDGRIACNWAITFEDRAIWETMDRDDAIYIHRIAVEPHFRGKRLIDPVVAWAKKYALELGRKYVRLDTLGNNRKLIEHYTSAGFVHLGTFRLKDVKSLPLHYQQEPECQLFELPAV